MTPSPPSSNPSPPRQALLEALLAAHKAGNLEEALAQRPRAAQALARRWLTVVLGTAGDAWPAEHRLARAATLLLRWGLSQLRPDQALTLADIDRNAWLERTSWRPFLALMCHYGFEPVATFRDRYHARADEAAADTLCGLWSIGPSTFYRYLDKGKRLLAELLARPPGGARATALRRFVQHDVDAALGAASDRQREWHLAQAQRLQGERDALSALWHCVQARDAPGFLRLLQRAHVALANDAETDSLCALLAADDALTARQRFDLCLGQAALWRVRQAPERESQAYDQALRIASAQDDALMLGIVYGALGKFHEPRDGDRAFACYEESAEFLRRAAPSGEPDGAQELATEYLSTLVRLAWLHVLRNDPRSRTVLDSAQHLRDDGKGQPEVAAMLEQAWGEYWRRAGDLKRALEHKHRALNLYERIGDTRSVLATYTNLAPIYGQIKDFDRAIDYAQRVVRASEGASLEPEMLCSAHLNLGFTHFYQGQLDLAIADYRRGLEIAERAGLKLHVRRAHNNLAEAFYKKFQATRDPEEERQGDAHAAAAMALSDRDGDAARSDAIRRLKTEVLGNTAAVQDRLLPQEFAAHFEEMAEVQRQRAVLAIPVEPAAHVRAHLAIARAYLAVSTKEREAALALIERHRLGERFAAEFDALRSTFARELTREQRLAAQWQREAADLLRDDERRAAVLAELLRAGAINKSTYAQVGAVALATASKHLVALAERGLLSQTGKGPSTRYVLPP